MNFIGSIQKVMMGLKEKLKKSWGLGTYVVRNPRKKKENKPISLEKNLSVKSSLKRVAQKQTSI